MPPAQTNTSVRDMTQRLLEQFQKDVRARAQRPPPEQKRRELAPPPAPQPFDPPPAPAAGPAGPAGPSGPASPTGAFPVLAPPPPLAALTPQPPAALAQQPSAPSLPAVGAELLLDLGGKGSVLGLQQEASDAPAFRVKTAAGERLMRWSSAPPSPSPDSPRERCRRAAQGASPSPRLLWPVDVATAPGVTGFGCLMPAAEPRFVPLPDAVAPASSLRDRASAAIELAEAALALQSSGASLKGVTPRDALVDLARGEARLAGVERDLAGLASRHSPALAAPEARGDLYADLHALSVLVFWLLYRGHPFSGRKALASPASDAAALDRLCASPSFIFDATQASNEAVPLSQDPSGRAGGHAIPLWTGSPQELRDLFSQAFTEGLKNPGARPGASSLRLALARLRDAIFPCWGCHGDNVYDGAALQARGGAPPPCLHCGAALVLPARIRIGRGVVVLPQGARLFRHHVEVSKTLSSDVVAEISAHPQRPEILGIKNVSTTTWTIQWPDGKLLPLEPGKTIKLESGLKIQFGQQEGEVRR